MSAADPDARLPDRPRVLIVEADADLSLMIRAALAHAYELSVVGSAAEALRHAHRDPPALILLDGARELETLRALREDPRTADLPTLLLSDDDSEEALALALDLTDGHLAKPVEPVELGRLVARALGRSPEPAASAEPPSVEGDATKLETQSRGLELPLDTQTSTRSATETEAGLKVAPGPRAATFDAGHRVTERYVVRELLGQGGMGEVYLVWDVDASTQRALKVMRPERSLRPESRRRFLEEARIASTLEHPHVLPIHDFGSTEDERLFLVMDYCAQGTLADLLQREGRLAPERAARLTLQLLDGLEHAHRHGVLHRDIKPPNIMLGEGEQVKIADFGLARDLLHTAAEGFVQGKAVGTPTYMSPESVRGEPPDQRTDLYGVGVVLYEMLTGTPPFRGRSTHRVLLSHLDEEPRAPSELGDTPPALDAVVLKALAKDRRQRWQSATELRAALRDALPSV